MRSKKIKFILDFGKALHSYGASAPRLESALTVCSKGIGFSGEFFSTPTSIIFNLNTEDGKVINRMARVIPGGFDLEKLTLVDETADKVVSGELTLDEGSYELQRIIKAKGRYGYFLRILSYAFISLGLAIIFNGNVETNIASFVLGGIAGFLIVSSHKWHFLEETIEITVPIIISFIVTSLAARGESISFGVAVMSTLIVLIPGLSFTLAMAELACQNLVSGTARLMGALISFCKICFGVLLGSKMGEYLFGEIVPDLEVFEFNSSLMIFLAVIGSGISFSIIFKARPRDILWMLAFSASAFYINLFITVPYHENLGVFIGGIFVAAGSNLIAKIRKSPATITYMAGIILFVPGTIGMKCINFLFAEDMINALTNAAQLVSVSFSITAGLYLGNLIIRPARSL